MPEVSVCVVLLGGLQVLGREQTRLLAGLLLLAHAPGPEHTNTHRVLAAGAAAARAGGAAGFVFWLQTGGGHRAGGVSGVHEAGEVMQRRSKLLLHEKKACGQQSTAAVALAVCFLMGVSVGTRRDAASTKVNALRCAGG